MSGEWPPPQQGAGEQGSGEQWPSPHGPQGRGSTPQGPQGSMPQGPHGGQPSWVPVRGPHPEPAQWLPWYGASFLGAVRRFFRKYARFAGRASRSEFWWAYLGVYIVTFVVEIPLMAGVSQWEFRYLLPDAGSSEISSEAAANPLWVYQSLFQHPNPTFVVGLWVLAVWWLAVLFPILGLMVRRLHDTNRRGWWVLVGLIPFVGSIVVIVLLCLESDPRGQRFDRAH